MLIKTDIKTYKIWYRFVNFFALKVYVWGFKMSSDKDKTPPKTSNGNQKSFRKFMSFRKDKKCVVHDGGAVLTIGPGEKLHRKQEQLRMWIGSVFWKIRTILRQKSALQVRSFSFPLCLRTGELASVLSSSISSLWLQTLTSLLPCSQLGSVAASPL